MQFCLRGISLALAGVLSCLLAMPALASEEGDADVLKHPGISICLHSPKDRDILQLDLNLTQEELKVISDLVVSETGECALWLSACRAVLEDVSKDYQQKRDAITTIPVDEKSAAFLKTANANLDQVLSEGQKALLGIWIEEEWKMLTGAPFAPKAGASSFVEFLKTRMTIPENVARRIRQDWSYYKTIELTHRQKLRKFPDLDPQNDISYLRMMRVNVDEKTVQALDDQNRVTYKRIMRSQSLER